MYYYHLLAKEHPGISGAWNYKLDASLQSTSTTKPGDTADCKSTSTLTSSGTSKGTSDLLLRAIERTSNILPNDNKERQELLKAQTKLAQENQKREQWKEYDLWGECIMKLKQQDGSEQMLRNIARRVRSLETEIGIPVDCSIVAEYV